VEEYFCASFVSFRRCLEALAFESNGKPKFYPEAETDTFTSMCDRPAKDERGKGTGAVL
jgi:hypothetical protein